MTVAVSGNSEVARLHRFGFPWAAPWTSSLGLLGGDGQQTVPRFLVLQHLVSFLGSWL